MKGQPGNSPFGLNSASVGQDRIQFIPSGPFSFGCLNDRLGSADSLYFACEYAG